MSGATPTSLGLLLTPPPPECSLLSCRARWTACSRRWRPQIFLRARWPAGLRAPLWTGSPVAARTQRRWRQARAVGERRQQQTTAAPPLECASATRNFSGRSSGVRRTSRRNGGESRCAGASGVLLQLPTPACWPGWLLPRPLSPAHSPACPQEHATSAAVAKTNFRGSISSVFVPYLRSVGHRWSLTCLITASSTQFTHPSCLPDPETACPRPHRPACLPACLQCVL